MFCLIFTAFANYGNGVTSIPAAVYGCYATKQECVAKLYKGVEEGRTVVRLANGSIASIDYYPNSRDPATTLTCANKN